MLQKIDGYKTYISAILIAVYAISGLLMGYHDGNEAFKLVLEAIALASIRHAI